MSDMISQQLTTAGAYTLIASGPITRILLTGVPRGWELVVAASLPAPEVAGMPVTSSDGVWEWDGLEAADNVYARPFGPLVGQTPGQTIKGIMN